MDAEKYRRSISLLCPTCGEKDFEHGIGDGPLRCLNCNSSFTREELIRENGDIIEAEVDEVKAEILKDVKQEFRNTLKNAFKGSKHIKFK